MSRKGPLLSSPMEEDKNSTPSPGAIISPDAQVHPPAGHAAGRLDVMPTLLVTSCCVFAAIGSFLFGYDIGIISSAIVQPDFERRFGAGQLSDAAAGGVVSSFTAGAVIGTLVVSLVSDVYGRRVAIFCGAISACLGGALQGGANALVTVILGRIFAGFGVGLFSPTIPNYCSEVAPPRIRGLLAGTQQWMIGLGIVTAQWVGYGGSLTDDSLSWRLPLGLQVVPSLLLAIGILFLPESPRFLAKQGQTAASYRVLEKLHLGRNETNRWLVDAEFKQIEETLRFEREGAAITRWSVLLQLPPMRRRLLLACSIQLFTQCSGTNVIAYYSPRIYQSLGYDYQGSLFILGLYGAFAQVYNTICLVIVDKVGRRKLLIPSMLGMGAALCVEATLTKYFDPATTTDTNALRASVAMNFVFALCFTSLGVLSWVYPSEIFPTSIRSKGTSLSTLTNWAINLIIAQCSPIALSRLGYRYFYIFAAFNWTAAVLVFLYYPETIGKSLEEVSDVFGDSSISTSLLSQRRSDVSDHR